jgi:2-iminobutanoate/2-iminopropanoate deaminase
VTIVRFPADLESGALSADATVVGDLVFATVIPLGADGEGEGDGIEAQSRVVFDALRGVLEDAGSGLDQLAHMTIYLADLARDRAGFNAVYSEYLPGPVPVRAAVGVDALARPGMLVEVTAIAARTR